MFTNGKPAESDMKYSMSNHWKAQVNRYPAANIPFGFHCYNFSKESTMSSISEYGWDQEMPMSLHDKLRADLKKAMLNKDPEVRNTMRLIMAEFPKLTVPITLNSGKKTTRLKKAEEITNDDIIGVIKGLVKSEQTVLEATRQETSEYLEILQSYLPKMASREEIIKWIKDNIDFAGYKNRMQAMGPVMKHFGKLADGRQVNQILSEWE
jgi:uncharacterized protein YqeY